MTFGLDKGIFNYLCEEKRYLFGVLYVTYYNDRCGQNIIWQRRVCNEEDRRYRRERSNDEIDDHTKSALMCLNQYFENKGTFMNFKWHLKNNIYYFENQKAIKIKVSPILFTIGNCRASELYGPWVFFSNEIMVPHKLSLIKWALHVIFVCMLFRTWRSMTWIYRFSVPIKHIAVWR